MENARSSKRHNFSSAWSLLRGLSYVLPNFENFEFMAAAAHGRAIPRALIAQNTAYAALYCAVVLAAARRHFHQAKLEMSTLASRTLLVAFFGASFAGVWRLQHGIDTQLAVTHQEQDDLVLRSGPLLKALKPGVWRRWPPICTGRAVVQYYGNKHVTVRPISTFFGRCSM